MNEICFNSSMSGAEWAAWIAAAASALAVLTTFLVVYIQASHARKAERQRHADRIRAIAALLRHYDAAMRRLVSAFLAKPEPDANVRAEMEAVTETYEAIWRLQLHDATSEAAMTFLLEAKAVARDLHALFLNQLVEIVRPEDQVAVDSLLLKLKSHIDCLNQQASELG